MKCERLRIKTARGRLAQGVPSIEGQGDVIEYALGKCRGVIDVDEGFGDDNIVAFDGDLTELPTIRLKRHGAAAQKLSGCRLEFGAGARGSYTLLIGSDPVRLSVGAETRCIVDIRFWRKPVVEIGAGTTINGCKIVVDNAEVRIGPDCMFSDDVLVQAGDQHGLIDLETMLLTNTERKLIELGEHVWIGRRAMVMSGVSIASGCVLGAGAIATTSSKPCQYLVGVPARAVRDNASWTRNPVGASAAEKSFFARMKQA